MKRESDSIFRLKVVLFEMNIFGTLEDLEELLLITRLGEGEVGNMNLQNGLKSKHFD